MDKKTKGINAVYTQVNTVLMIRLNRIRSSMCTLGNYKQVIADVDHGLFQMKPKALCNDSVVPTVRNHFSSSTARLQNSIGLWVSSTCCPWYIHSVSLAKYCMLELDVKKAFKSLRQQKMFRTIAQHKTRLHNFIYPLYICTTIIPLLQGQTIELPELA